MPLTTKFYRYETLDHRAMAAYIAAISAPTAKERANAQRRCGRATATLNALKATMSRVELRAVEQLLSH